MIELFLKGGPVMWPLLLLSVCAAATILERGLFLVMLWRTKNPLQVESLLESARKGTFHDLRGELPSDTVARVVYEGLAHPKTLTESLTLQAERALALFDVRIAVLDTTVTLAPLLGLLGTVVGMISSFKLLGTVELGAPTQITGGIAEALLATAFGLSIAILSLIALNFLQRVKERYQVEIEQAATALEIAMKERESSSR